MEYISNRTEFLHPHPVFHILSAQTILLCTQTQCFFVSHTHILHCTKTRNLSANQVNGDHYNIWIVQKLYPKKSCLQVCLNFIIMWQLSSNEKALNQFKNTEPIRNRIQTTANQDVLQKVCIHFQGKGVVCTEQI